MYLCALFLYQSMKSSLPLETLSLARTNCSAEKSQLIASRRVSLDLQWIRFPQEKKYFTRHIFLCLDLFLPFPVLTDLSP